MMISAMQPNELSQAIASSNTGALEKIKGIGRKSAERIILELRDKMLKSGIGSPVQGFAHQGIEEEALQALVALGIPKHSAEAALKKAKINATDDTLESLIKKSLQHI